MNITLPPLQIVGYGVEGARSFSQPMLMLVHDLTGVKHPEQFTPLVRESDALAAIQAVASVRVPMTMEQALPILCKWSDLVDSEEGPPNLAMAELISAIEAHHGIGAKP